MRWLHKWLYRFVHEKSNRFQSQIIFSLSFFYFLSFFSSLSLSLSPWPVTLPPLFFFFLPAGDTIHLIHHIQLSHSPVSVPEVKSLLPPLPKSRPLSLLIFAHTRQPFGSPLLSPLPSPLLALRPHQIHAPPFPVIAASPHRRGFAWSSLTSPFSGAALRQNRVLSFLSISRPCGPCRWLSPMLLFPYFVVLFSSLLMPLCVICCVALSIAVLHVLLPF
jgi:hypothetical protein